MSVNIELRIKFGFNIMKYFSNKKKIVYYCRNDKACKRTLLNKLKHTILTDIKVLHDFYRCTNRSFTHTHFYWAPE